jgi:serine/threonine protein kinase
MALEQGYQSFVSVNNGRLLKAIDCFDAYGNAVTPYEECKILKYVSRLGSEFPQNVTCEGPLRLSYDYIPGVTLERYIDRHFPLSVREQKYIALQLFRSYRKLWEAGIEHGDYNAGNFLIDPDGQVHVLDFGSVSNPYREIIWKSPYHSSCSSSEDEEIDYEEPIQEYEDITFPFEEARFLETIEGFISSLMEGGLFTLEDGLGELLLQSAQDWERLLLILI